MNEPVAFALAYAAEGREIFPCKADGSPLTDHGFKDASRDPTVLTRWWSRFRFAEPAWRLPPDILVSDLDEKHGKHGVADFRRLAGHDPLDVQTPIASTRSGGLHLRPRTAGRQSNQFLRRFQSFNGRAVDSLLQRYRCIHRHRGHSLRCRQ